MKRSLDFLGAMIGLLILSPLLAVSAAAVRFSSPGPAIYRQERVGRHGTPFEIRKLRTMRVGAAGPAVTVGDDPRITCVGRWLRSTKLDELPQLWNVVRGDMSLVGPRPEVPQYVALWSPEDREVILSVRPGITDPASIEFRREAEALADVSDPERYYVEVVLPRKVALYRDYVSARTLRKDLAILVRTVRTVVTG